MKVSAYGGETHVRQFLALSGAAITSSGGVVTPSGLLRLGPALGGKDRAGGQALYLLAGRSSTQ